ncbi:CRISPR-associated helicase Cas3' [Thorsellia kenyensis]|uniref:CRISPR-associated helicase Cas3 n=1 Tax=Thorsellia kenyensis TaxID=1549888 RepID=A0ABV6C738_9GAMM
MEKYWGKINSKTENFHLLVYHSLDVAAVAWQLLNPNEKLCKDLANFLGLTTKQTRVIITFFVALHDLGKFTDAFQRLARFDPYLAGGFKKAFDYNPMDLKHDALAFLFFENILEKISFWHSKSNVDVRGLRQIVKPLFNAVFGHHGLPVEVSGQALLNAKKYVNEQNFVDVNKFIDRVFELLSPEFPDDWFVRDKELANKTKQISWIVAGVAVLSDWLGSNTEYFSYLDKLISLKKYWELTQSQALTAIREIGLMKRLQAQEFISFEKTFGFRPTDLQSWAERVKLVETPQLFILEDTTGSGKTEAALTIMHRLLNLNDSQGFFFGLPTQATTNAMYERVIKYFSNSLSYPTENSSITLAHSANSLNKTFISSINFDHNDYHSNEESILSTCHRWFSDSRKKILLAQVGVGTIDQALLATLPQKHQSLRLLGLFGKVLILDEIHTADTYVDDLLKNLMTIHASYGGSMVLLTATLSKKQKLNLINHWERLIGVQITNDICNQFPLATVVNGVGTISESLKSNSNNSREIGVQFLHDIDECCNFVIKKANEGCCIVWIRNTVDESIQAYHKIKKLVNMQDKVILFHSRFTLSDRQLKEELIHRYLGKASDNSLRQHTVIIATQVFQESLDVDTDLLISDICPMDHLIQRVGRLHRHIRDENGKVNNDFVDKRPSPIVYIHSPIWDQNPSENWLSKDFLGTEAVYQSPARIWLTMKILIELAAIRMPKDARLLIESVYGDDVNIPINLQNKDILVQSKDIHKINLAHNVSLKWAEGYSKRSVDSGNWLNDTLEASTRYSERDVRQVIVCKRINGELVFYHDSLLHYEYSVIKVDSNKYAKNLLQPTDIDQQIFVKKYSATKFVQIWCHEEDENYGYESEVGFYVKEKKQ